MEMKRGMALTLMLLAPLSFAETCPSVHQVKHNLLVGWIAYDSDDGKPLSAKRRAAFIKHADEFALAEWSKKDKLHGAIHCYYKDRTGSALEAYLGKANFALNDTNRYWYQVSGFKQCAAGMEKCDFNQHPFLQQQLAKK